MPTPGIESSIAGDEEQVCSQVSGFCWRRMFGSAGLETEVETVENCQEAELDDRTVTNSSSRIRSSSSSYSYSSSSSITSSCLLVIN